MTSEVHWFIGVVGGTRGRSNEGADVIDGVEYDAAYGITAVLVAISDFLTGLGGALLVVVVALQVTPLCKH